MCKYDRKKLEAEYLENGEINVCLSKMESMFLGELINCWYNLSRNSTYPVPISLIVKVYDKIIFTLKMRKAFSSFPNASEIFRFYILYKGKKQLYIDAKDSPDNSSIKNIKIFKLWHT